MEEKEREKGKGVIRLATPWPRNNGIAIDAVELTDKGKYSVRNRSRSRITGKRARTRRNILEPEDYSVNRNLQRLILLALTLFSLSLSLSLSLPSPLTLYVSMSLAFLISRHCLCSLNQRFPSYLLWPREREREKERSDFAPVPVYREKLNLLGGKC